MSLRAGDTVEHFVIVSPLGEGGMGQVYVARDTRLQRSIALKIMQPEAAGDASGKGASNGAARLLREAQSAAGLEHPNVVTIYEVGEIKGEGEEAGRPFIAMELVKGRPLRAFVGDERIPMKERVRWLADIGRALAAAHKTGLVHRDIKPENVMVRDDGVIKVLDFGLAKRAASTSNSASSSTEAQVLPSLTGKGVAIGTPYYMAPEQMRNEVLDGRADQFAWGVVAYELLSGTPAWGRDIGALELVAKLLSEDPAPLAELRPDVPAHVAAVVTRAMAKRKGARFETMEEVIVALEDAGGVFAPTMPRISLSAPEPSEVHPPAAVERGTTTVSLKPPGRRRWLFALVTGGVLAVSALAFVAGTKRAAHGPVVGSASRVSPARECTGNTECVAKLGGKPAVCNAEGRCAAIESVDCKALFEPGDLKRDDTVWIGTMYPLSGPNAEVYGLREAETVDLARMDFAQVMGRFAARGPTGDVHPLALVSCDDAVDAARAAKHLVSDLHVPGVIGIPDASALLDLAASLFIPSRTLVVATLTTDPLVTTLPEPPNTPRLIWRTTYTATESAAPIAEFVSHVVEPRVRAKLHAPTRVAVVRGNTAGAQAVSEALFSDLHFNGKSALDNGRDYREFTVAPGGGANVVESLVDFAPQIVIFSGKDEIVRDVFEPLEASWHTSEPVRPTYIASTVLPPSAYAFAGASAERRHRFFGLTSVSTTTLNARLVLHYQSVFQGDMTRTTAANSSYDAFYLLAYASYAAGDAPITGDALARAIPKLLPPGKPIDVGPSSIFDGFTALRAGNSIDLNGSIGRLDFDPATGDAPIDQAILCVGVDDHGRAADGVESGLSYDYATRKLTGNLRCP